MLRVVVLLNAVGLNLFRADNFDHPVAGALCVLAMVVWTAYATHAYADPARRTGWLLAADLAVAVGLVLVSPLVKGEGLNATIPGFWVMGALLAWAIRLHWRGGLLAGVCIVAADVSVRQAELTQANYGNVFLLLIGGPIVGFMCESLQRMAAERDDAQREAVAEAERARLARAVHDGVLQVLALVQRRGAELGGEAAELGRLAGEQETVLRTLIRSQDSLRASVAPTVDLAAELAALEARPGVTVAGPGRPVEVDAHLATELVAVVQACLDNVSMHVGEGAPAWVLLEALPDEIEIDVRDAGPGIPEGRLEEAEREGRLGVSESIRGRIRDLSGTATVTSGHRGTEWEFLVPRQR